jgi:hypothetical protein
MWEPRRLTTVWASKAYYRDSFTFFKKCKMDMTFGIWKVRNPHRLAALKRVVRELAGYVTFNEMQEVIWDKGGTEPAGRCISFSSSLT